MDEDSVEDSVVDDGTWLIGWTLRLLRTKTTKTIQTQEELLLDDKEIALCTGDLDDLWPFRTIDLGGICLLLKSLWNQSNFQPSLWYSSSCCRPTALWGGSM